MKDETKIELIKELSKGNVTIKQLIMEVNGTLNYYENQEENGNKFAGVDYKEWDKYEPTKTENTIFKKCKAVADAFEEAISLPLG